MFLGGLEGNIGKKRVNDLCNKKYLEQIVQATREQATLTVNTFFNANVFRTSLNS